MIGSREEALLHALGFEYDLPPSARYARLYGGTPRRCIAWLVPNGDDVRLDIRHSAEGQDLRHLGACYGIRTWAAPNGDTRVRWTGVLRRCVRLGSDGYEVIEGYDPNGYNELRRVVRVLRFVATLEVTQGGRRRRATRAGERRFGIEIEFNGIRYERVVRALSDAGIELSDAYSSSTEWILKTDGSVRGTGTGGSGWELVSPPLKGADGFRQVRTAARALMDAGGRVDSSCGLHVHHEVADVRTDGIQKFIRSWFDNQSLLDWLVSRSRRASSGGASYCRRMTTELLTAVEAGRLNSWGRYYVVNPSSFSAHGTLEVRQHQGTLDGDKIVAWVKLGQAILDSCKKKRAPITRQENLHRFFHEAELDQDTQHFFINRAREFGAPAALVVA